MPPEHELDQDRAQYLERTVSLLLAVNRAQADVLVDTAAERKRWRMLAFLFAGISFGSVLCLLLSGL